MDTKVNPLITRKIGNMRNNLRIIVTTKKTPLSISVKDDGTFRVRDQNLFRDIPSNEVIPEVRSLSPSLARAVNDAFFPHLNLPDHVCLSLGAKALAEALGGWAGSHLSCPQDGDSPMTYVVGKAEGTYSQLCGGFLGQAFSINEITETLTAIPT